VSLVLAPPPPWVTIDLDTTGPALVFEPAPSRAQPPDSLLAVAASDEPLGEVRAWFADAGGAEQPLGVEVDGLAVRVLLPTVGLTTGPGSLVVLARDLSCNTSRTALLVYIDRPRPFDLQGATMGTSGTQASASGGYDLQAEPAPTALLQARPEATHDLQAETAAAFTLDSEMRDG
jgi:hypothetical protein